MENMMTDPLPYLLAQIPLGEGVGIVATGAFFFLEIYMTMLS